MGDIDILIPKEQMEEWSRFLINKGLERQYEKTWGANKFKRLFIAKGTEEAGLISVELHTRLFYDEPVNFMWGTTTSPYSGLNYLESEELFVHLCGHFAYQHTFINLQWLYDIALMIKIENLDWSKVKKISKKVNVYRSCELVCFILKRDFHIKTSLKIGLLAKLIGNILISKEFLCFPTEKKIHYFMVKTFCKDSLWYAFKYQFLWAWTHVKSTLKTRSR